MLKCIPDRLIPPKMFNEAVEHDPMMLKLNPDHFMTQEISEKATDRYKTKDVCKNYTDASPMI